MLGTPEHVEIKRKVCEKYSNIRGTTKHEQIKMRALARYNQQRTSTEMISKFRELVKEGTKSSATFMELNITFVQCVIDVIITSLYYYLKLTNIWLTLITFITKLLAVMEDFTFATLVIQNWRNQKSQHKLFGIS